MTPSQFNGSPGAGSPEPDGDEQGQDMGVNPDAQGNALTAVVEQVRGMEQQLQSLAQQFPAAAPEIRRATESVRAVLKRIVSSPSQPEPPAPTSMA